MTPLTQIQAILNKAFHATVSNASEASTIEKSAGIYRCAAEKMESLAKELRERESFLSAEMTNEVDSWQIPTDSLTPEILAKYKPGKGCVCGSYCEQDCSCEVDWTDPEIYQLRMENLQLKKKQK